MDSLARNAQRGGQFRNAAEVLDCSRFIHCVAMVKPDLLESQARLTRHIGAIAKLAGMAKLPTPMGARILTFMQANGIENRAQFAEGVLGISRQRFHGWLYNKIDPALIPAKPLLLCAEALGTNAEYLLGLTDDPRVETSLDHLEAQLVQAFRDMPEPDRDRLLSIAASWVGASGAKATTAAPFRSLLPAPKK